MRYVALTLVPLLVAACTEQDPVAPDSSPQFSATAGMNKMAISGTIISVAEPPDLKPPLVTPSGICHLRESPGITEYTGDVAGIVTFHRRIVNVACSFDPGDIGSFAGNGPVDGEVTFLGRTGWISGMWTVNCQPDPVTLWSCGGAMTARGSGELAGVQFHFDWSTGWFPFTYTGTAFYR